MTKKQVVKALVAERLTAAVEEIFSTVERMITERRTLNTPGERLCDRQDVVLGLCLALQTKKQSHKHKRRCCRNTLQLIRETFFFL